MQNNTLLLFFDQLWTNIYCQGSVNNYVDNMRWVGTGKSLSEALILSSTNPQYDKRLFIQLQVQYMKIASSEHVVYANCFMF